MKKTVQRKAEKNPLITQEFHIRLAELEMELRQYPARPAAERPLKTIEKPEAAMIGQEKVVQFSINGKSYAAGHTDVTYPGANHARGVRHIRFYAGGTTVLDIEGDYEDQQFGSNFRFQNIDLHVPGAWEPDFVKVTDELHDFKAKRRHAFNKKRVAERRKLHRSS
jgi:hypothetical protein